MPLPQRRLMVSWAALEECCQQVKEDDSYSVMRRDKATPGVLGASQLPEQDRNGHTG